MEGCAETVPCACTTIGIGSFITDALVFEWAAFKPCGARMLTEPGLLSFIVLAPWEGTVTVEITGDCQTVIRRTAFASRLPLATQLSVLPFCLGVSLFRLIKHVHRQIVFCGLVTEGPHFQSNVPAGLDLSFVGRT